VLVRGDSADVACFLKEIPELAGVPAYWVNSAACVDVARNKVTHKLAHGELIETEPWIKDGPITIGIHLAHNCSNQIALVLTCSDLSGRILASQFRQHARQQNFLWTG